MSWKMTANKHTGLKKIVPLTACVKKRAEGVCAFVNLCCEDILSRKHKLYHQLWWWGLNFRGKVSCWGWVRRREKWINASVKSPPTRSSNRCECTHHVWKKEGNGNCVCVCVCVFLVHQWRVWQCALLLLNASVLWVPAVRGKKRHINKERRKSSKNRERRWKSSVWDFNLEQIR